MDNPINASVNLGIFINFILLLTCFHFIIKSRLDILCGVYCSYLSYNNALIIFGVPFIWIIITSCSASMILFIRKYGGFKLPNKDRQIIALLGFWWTYTLILLTASGFYNFRSIGTTFISVMLPIFFVILISKEFIFIKRFAAAFLVTTILGGVLYIYNLMSTSPDLIINPITGNQGMGRLPVYNYHKFSYPFGISFIFLITLFISWRGMLLRFILILGFLIVTYFLYFLGSRQTMIATLIASLVFLLWIGYKNIGSKTNKSFSTVAIITVLLFGIYYIANSFYALSDFAISRGFDISLGVNASDLIAQSKRSEQWQLAIDAIFDSFFLGTAYGFDNAHNIILAILVNEGVIGIFFFILYIKFFIKQSNSIFSSVNDLDLQAWQITFFLIFISTLIHSQFSGDNISSPEFYWAPIMLWFLRYPKNYKYRDNPL